MSFGKRLRSMRKSKGLSQKQLAELVSVNFTYLSKIENERLDFAQFPSEDLIRRLASALEADVDELLVLAHKVPDDIRQRVMQRPEAFRRFASLNDEDMDHILRNIDQLLKKCEAEEARNRGLNSQRSLARNI